jgi:L-seryl-tRNA(Ser) seleniumtransferase
MISATPASLRARARAIVGAQPATVRDRVEIASMASTIGGGSLPGETLESVGLVVTGPARGRGATALAATLRAGEPAVVGRIEADAVHLDLRTVDPRDDESLTGALARALGAAGA